MSYERKSIEQLAALSPVELLADHDADNEPGEFYSLEYGDLLVAALRKLLSKPGPKNKKQWRASGLQLHKFLQPGDEISEGLHNYIGGATSPQYCSPAFTQMGEANYEQSGVLFYMTTQIVGDKFLYLGILPEFKQ